MICFDYKAIQHIGFHQFAIVLVMALPATDTDNTPQLSNVN